MADFIEEYIDQNKKIHSFLDQIGSDYENADKNLGFFKEFLKEHKYNVALGIHLAKSLQMAGKERNFSDFELTDISRLFDSLLVVQIFNIDTYVEAGHFEWSIMGNNQKALEIVKKGLARATEKVEELKSLLLEIEGEKYRRLKND